MFFVLFFSFLSFCSATILPPGFVVRQFGHTRDKVSSMKIEQKIALGQESETFNETIYFLKPSYLKTTVEKNGESVTLTRRGSECEIATSSKKVSGVSCSGIKSNFYYNLLLPYGSVIDYLKSLNINTREGLVSIKKTPEGEYLSSEDTIIFKDDQTPIFIIGLDKNLYKAAVEESRSSKDMLKTILDNIKEKSPQLWANKNDFTPRRVYGKKNSGDTVEITLSSYIKDASEVLFPGRIELYVNAQEKVSYSVKSFETNVQLTESLFKSTAQQGVDISSLSETKKKLVEYLRDYR